MDTDINRTVHILESGEINALLRLYYNRYEEIKGSDDLKEETLQSLADKNLIINSLNEDGNIITLTDFGLSVCGSVILNKIKENKDIFNQKIQKLPERAIACLVNRVMWKDVVSKETGDVDPATKPYALDESLWYERALLKEKRVRDTLEKFYCILEDIGFICNVDGLRMCSPEVENFLKKRYINIMDLSWSEEDSLKYYYFFYIYAQDQRNLIDFSGEGEDYRSMFFGEKANPPDYWYSSNKEDPRSFLNSLGISEVRIMSFLKEMKIEKIVSERYFPLSSFSFFSNEEKIFIIDDINSFMNYIKNKFLRPVVDSLIS